MSDPKLLDAYYVDGLVAATGSLSSDISTLQTATGVLRADIDSNDADISTLQNATGVLRADIDSNDADISTLQTATGTLQQATGKALGSNTQIQFNDNGNLNGSSDLTWDDNGLYANGYISGDSISGKNIYSTSGIYLDIGVLGVESAAVGQLNWNSVEETVNIGLNSEVNLQVGLEQLMRIKAGGQDIRNGMAVYAQGAVGGSDNIIVDRYITDRQTGPEEFYFLGIATQSLLANQEGFITTFGKVRAVNGNYYTNGGVKDDNDSDAWTVGTILYCSPFQSGTLTSTKPVSPNRIIPIADVLKIPNSGNVTLFIRAEHGYDLEDLHDVWSGDRTNNSVLTWHSGTARWEADHNINVTGNIYSAQTISGGNILGQEITDLQAATGILRSDINSNDTDISALQTATGILSKLSVTGSLSIHAPDLTGVGQVTVTLDGSTIKISGASAGGGTPAGSDNQIQFNDGGSFGASSNLTWDDNGLYVNGYISGGSISATSISAPEITNLQAATGTLRADIDSNDTEISALQTATGVLSQVSVTGSSSIHAPDLTGVGQVTVTLDGSTIKISGASAGGGTPAGSDNQIQFNDGGSFGASSNLTWDDNGLYVNGYITGQAISGASFHGPHFVSAPYSIGNINGAVTIDFNNGSAQYATLNGNVTSFAASNVAAGESVTVQFTTTSARTIAGGSTLAFIGQHPTSLSANMTGILSLMSFDGSTVVAGFAVQTGVA